MAKRPKRPKWAEPFTMIDVALKSVAAKLAKLGIHGDARIKKNPNGTVDAELRVRVDKSKRLGVRRIITEIEIAMKDEKPVRGKGFWLSSGLRYRPREDEPFYRKWAGMSQVEVYPQRARKQALHFVTTRDVHENLKSRGRKAAEQIFLRLHWNSADKQPKRK